MKKSVISLFLVLAILLGTFQAVTADEGKLLFSESFQGFAENATVFSKIKINSGLDGRVIKDGDNKVLFARALGQGIDISFDIPESSAKETIMSAKLNRCL